MHKGEMFSKNRNSVCFPISTVLNFIWEPAQLTHFVAKIQGKKNGNPYIESEAEVRMKSSLCQTWSLSAKYEI